MAFQIMLVAIRPVVELIHSVICLSVNKSSPERHEKGWHDKHDTSSPQSDHGPSTHSIIDQSGDNRGTRRIATEISVINHVLQRVEKDDGVVFGFDFIAKTRVLFHVVIEFMLFTLLQQPCLVIAALMSSNICLM